MDGAETGEAVAPVDAEGEHRRSLRRAATMTAGFGIAYSVLFLLAAWLMSSVPGARASDQEIADFYNSGDKRRVILVGLYLMPFAGIAFIWFIVALRMWISFSVRRENALLSNIQLVSGIIFVTLFFASAAANSVLAASMEFSDAPVDPVVAREFPQFGNSLLFVFGMRMGAMFVFTTSNIGRAAGTLPRWFTYLGFAVGLFMLLSASFQPWFVLVFPIWLLILSGFLLYRARQIPASLVVPPRPPIVLIRP
ncbi:MAG TPA: hypothetical protein VH482_03675 [Thermomicrobiales bacterium]|jgi:hypothetical protein